MAFTKLSETYVECVHCHEPITFGQSMEFYVSRTPDRVETPPAHAACNEKAYAEEAQEADAR